MSAGFSSIHVVASAIRADELHLSGHTSPDGAITLLLSDIEDGRGLAAQLGEQRAGEMLRDHGAIVRQLIAAHDGTVASAQDDGFMASFASAHAGLRCAIDMQCAFAGHLVPQLGRELKPRIGLHSGFLIADADAFYGRNVVLAARIADHARGGEILVSDALREYTSSDPTFRFESRGSVRFKGLLGSHRIHSVPWR